MYENENQGHDIPTANSETNNTNSELVASQNNMLFAGKDTTPGLSEISARNNEAQDVQSQNDFNEAGNDVQPGTSGKYPARRKRAIVKKQ